MLSVCAKIDACYVLQKGSETLQNRKQLANQIASQIKEAADTDAAKAQAEGTITDPVGSSNNPSNAVFTVANVITFCRLILTLIFLWLFSTGGNRWVALGCYVTAAVTDFLDGQIARRTQTVSWLGKIMDPVMDRVLLITGVLGLLIIGELPVWIPLFVIGRDVYLTLGALIMRKVRRRPIDVVFVGKAATAFLMTGFSLLLLGIPVVSGLGLVNVDWLPGLNSQNSAVGIFFVYIGIVFSAITAIVYTGEAAKIYKDSKSTQA